MGKDTEECSIEYSITLIPIPIDSPVMYRGKDYTITAKSHSIKLDRRQFYLRENNTDRRDLLRRAIGASLDQLVIMIGPSKPLKISISLDQE